MRDRITFVTLEKFILEPYFPNGVLLALQGNGTIRGQSYSVSSFAEALNIADKASWLRPGRNYEVYEYTNGIITEREEVSASDLPALLEFSRWLSPVEGIE